MLEKGSAAPQMWRHVILADWSFTREVHEHSSGGAIVATADCYTRHVVEQRRVPDGMLAASHRMAAGHAGLRLALPLITS